MAKKGVRKPENRREALACLHTVAEHIEKTLKAYRVHKLPRPVAGDDADLRHRAGAALQRLADLLRLRRFVRAVKAHSSAANKKSLEQLLGLKPLPWPPRGSGSARQNPWKAAQNRAAYAARSCRGKKSAGAQMTAQAGEEAARARVANLGEARARAQAKKATPLAKGKNRISAEGRRESGRRKPATQPLGKNRRAQSPRA